MKNKIAIVGAGGAGLALAKASAIAMGNQPIVISKNPISPNDKLRLSDMKTERDRRDFEEYQLILQKKSKLSAMKRKAIVDKFNQPNKG